MVHRRPSIPGQPRQDPAWRSLQTKWRQQVFRENDCVWQREVSDVTMCDMLGPGCCYADLSERSSSTQPFTNRVERPDESILPVRCYYR